MRSLSPSESLLRRSGVNRPGAWLPAVDSRLDVG